MVLESLSKRAFWVPASSRIQDGTSQFASRKALHPRTRYTAQIALKE